MHIIRCHRLGDGDRQRIILNCPRIGRPFSVFDSDKKFTTDQKFVVVLNWHISNYSKQGSIIKNETY